MVISEILHSNKSVRVTQLTVESLFIFVRSKLYDSQSFSFTHCSWQEPSESTSISLITLPLSLLPFISLAKLTALKFGVNILVTAFVEVIITEAKSHCRYMIILSFDLALIVKPLVSSATQLVRVKHQLLISY